MTVPNQSEQFRPPPNDPPGDTLLGKLRFTGRTVADLQVSSVLQHLKPWLADIRGTVLEVGCGAQPYRHFVSAGCQYTGLDWDQAEEGFSYRTPDTIYYDGGEFPFTETTFDFVFHTEVLEHIYYARQFLGECRRVLKPGGRIFFTVPFQARYHYIPWDYFRYTPAALSKILAEAGFREVVVIPRGNDITVAAYKILGLVYRWLQEGLTGKVLGCAALPIAVLCLLVGHLSLRFKVGSRDDCLGYAVHATA